MYWYKISQASAVPSLVLGRGHNALNGTLKAACTEGGRESIQGLLVKSLTA